MKRTSFHFVSIFGLMFVFFSASAAAQVSKSSAIAKELVQVMESKKLDSIAAKIQTGAPNAGEQPSARNFAAALYFPNVQLLLISGHYSAPQLMEPRLAGKHYRDTYMELSGTVTPKRSIGAPALENNVPELGWSCLRQWCSSMPTGCVPAPSS